MLEEFILPDGTAVRLGNIIPDAGLMRAWPVYGDTATTPMLTPDQLLVHAITTQEAFDDVRIGKPHYQNGIGMCNGSAIVKGMEIKRHMQGLEHVDLSGGDLYMRICGGVDRGSLLEDGMRESMERGVAPVSITPYLDWRGENPGAAESRKRYRVLEAFLCPTFEHCASAVAYGCTLDTGIMWGNGDNPDGDGWLPRRVAGGGGHAICGYALVRRGDELGIAHINSWGPSFGRNGRFVIPKSRYTGPVGGWWAIRSVTDEGGVVPMLT